MDSVIKQKEIELRKILDGELEAEKSGSPVLACLKQTFRKE